MSITITKELEQQGIKPRRFTLMLSDDDARVFSELAAASAATPAELLTGFVCDLVNGTQTHGSDERDLARQYLERCYYGTFKERTFLHWALQEYRMEELEDLLETLEYAAGDLAYYAENPTDPDGTPEFIGELEQEHEKILAEIDSVYREYQTDLRKRGEFPQEKQGGIRLIKSYLQAKEENTGAQIGEDTDGQL